MAKTLPQEFPPVNPPAIASYDYDDIRNGIAYTTYYLFSTEDSVGDNYVIDTEPVYTVNSRIELDCANDETPVLFTFYSNEFLIPKDVFGDILTRALAKTNIAKNSYAEIKVYHYDGTTSTQIGSTWTSHLLNSGGTSETHLNAKINVPSVVHFKVGDQIKVEVNTVGVAGAGAGNFKIGNDPQNRDGDLITPSTDTDHYTTFKLLMPFLPEL